MNFLKNYRAIKGIIMCFSLLLIFSCSENKNSASDDIGELLYNFHSKNFKTDSLKKDFKILIIKTIDDNYTVVFYKINTNHYYSFIDNTDNIISVKRIKNREDLSLYDKNQCFVIFEKEKKTVIPQENDYCFTIFIGKVPTDKYSEIEIEWNCSEKSNQELVDSKYFFFFRKNAGDQICNLKLKTKKGKMKKLGYSHLNQRFELLN